MEVKMNKTKVVLLVLSILLCSGIAFADTINVPGDQPTIQAGIDASFDGDIVLVQPGTYVENINYNGKNITVASFYLTTQDTIYISQTIIDGNQNGSVVTFESGEDSTAVLIGFTITNGNGTITVPGESYGGGILCLDSSPILKYLKISDNSAAVSGGGIFLYNSNSLIENVEIVNNNVYYQGGGGIALSVSNPYLKNVLIADNHSNSSGGGLYCYTSNPYLKDVLITGNTASIGSFWGGGGIVCVSHSSPILENVIISSNTAENGGGVSCVASSSPSLINSLITDNIVSQYGSGIFCHQQSHPCLVNTTITNNSASNNGGGIYCLNDSNPLLLNCILWNNLPQEIFFHSSNTPNSVTISYSGIQGGEAGIVTNNNGTVNWLEGNIDLDPLFIGSGDDPYSLLEDSPCIEAGIPDTVGLNLPLWDIIGNHRIWDGDGNGSAIIDMGAYEYGSPPYVDVEDNVIVQTPEIFLQQNYPNPFNPITTISFSIPIYTKVSLTIYNIKGQKVKQLVSDQLSAGEHSKVWDGKADNGKSVSSGIYFYKIIVNGKSGPVKKCILMK